MTKPPPTDVEFVENDFAIIELHPDGFVHIHSKPVLHTFAQAEVIVDTVQGHHERLGHKARMLVDLRPLLSVERDARNLYRAERHARNVFGSALLIGSGVSQILGNFFMGLNKRTLAPTQLFTNVQAAREWLDSLR